MYPSDVVLRPGRVSAPHHPLAKAADFLSSQASKATVLVFANIWTEPLKAIRSLPVDQAAWGFPQAGGGFGRDGVLRGTMLPSVVFGRLGGLTERIALVLKHFESARVNLEAHSDPNAQEPREILRDTLTEARRLGIPAPRLEATEWAFSL